MEYSPIRELYEWDRVIAERDLNRVITDNATTAIFMMDAEGRCTFMNPAAEEMMGFAFHEIEGETFHDRVHPHRHDGSPFPMGECPIDSSIMGKQSLRGHEDVFVRRDGTLFPVRCSASPIMRDGVPSGIVLEVTDISEQKQAEAALSESEAGYRTLTELCPDAIFINANGRFVYANAAAVRVLGAKDAGEIIGRSPYEFIETDFHPRVQERIRQVLEDRSTAPLVEYRWRRLDGTPIDVEVSAGPITWQGVPGVQVMLRDISGRKRAEEALRESEERFRMLADNITQLAWMADADGWIFWYNRQWHDYTGTTLEEMEGWGWQAVHHPDHVDRVVEKFRDHIQRGETWEDTFPLRGADGNYRWFLSRAQPIRDKGGRILRWFGTNTDITRLREAQNQLADYAHKLEEADRRKDEFLAMLAHELRNPLAPVLNALYLMKMPQANETIRSRALETMDRQVRHMARLIEDLLNVSRILRGKVEVRHDRLDLNAVVGTAIADWSSTLSEQQQELRLQLTPTPLPVSGDAIRLTQVLGNLLHNASKFSEPGDTITVRTEVIDGSARVIVEDTGVGIEADHLERVFDAFMQADRSLDRTRGGLGLGLAMVKGIVELHSGEVRAESDGPNQGARFSISLPLIEEVREAASAPAGVLTLHEGRMRVLIIEDNTDSADLLELLLSGFGYTVTKAYDGETGLERAREERPDVILCDIGLPRQNGYEVAREIRRIPELQEVTLIALTGYGSEDDTERVQAAGFDAHLIKPVDPDDLLQRLRKCSPPPGPSDR